MVYFARQLKIYKLNHNYSENIYLNVTVMLLIKPADKGFVVNPLRIINIITYKHFI